MSVLDKPYDGTPETVLHIFRVAHGPHGSQSWAVRKWVEDVVKNVRARDYVSEGLAIFWEISGPKFRYTHDPVEVELVKSPEKMLYEIRERGVALGDCDDLTAISLAAYSAAGIPTRVGTGAFELDREIWPQLGKELPERLGFKVVAEERAFGPFSHVWPEFMRPDGSWVMVDPVAGPDAKQMRRRLKQVRYYQAR